MAHQRLTETSKLLAILMRELGDASTSEPDEGWLATRDLMPLLGYTTMGGARDIADRLVAAGFAERKVIKHGNVVFRLSPKFKTWKEAHEAQKVARAEKVPAGWAPLSVIAKDMGMTTRALQYQATAEDIPFKVFNVPMPRRHYQRSRFRR
jgi:hypothetical protein